LVRSDDVVSCAISRPRRRALEVVSTPLVSEIPSDLLQLSTRFQGGLAEMSASTPETATAYGRLIARRYALVTKWHTRRARAGGKGAGEGGHVGRGAEREGGFVEGEIASWVRLSLR
jgi:hypothetical protein